MPPATGSALMTAFWRGSGHGVTEEPLLRGGSGRFKLLDHSTRS